MLNVAILVVGKDAPVSPVVESDVAGTAQSYSAGWKYSVVRSDLTLF